jgi:hypothetical protein
MDGISAQAVAIRMPKRAVMNATNRMAAASVKW